MLHLQIFSEMRCNVIVKMLNSNIIRKFPFVSYHRCIYSSDISFDQEKLTAQRKLRRMDPSSRLQTLIDEQVKNNNENEDNLSGNPVSEELKAKNFLKLRRRSLSPLSRVQTMIDSKNLDDSDITNKDNSK